MDAVRRVGSQMGATEERAKLKKLSGGSRLNYERKRNLSRQAPAGESAEALTHTLATLGKSNGFSRFLVVSGAGRRKALVPAWLSSLRDITKHDALEYMHYDSASYSHWRWYADGSTLAPLMSRLENRLGRLSPTCYRLWHYP
mgnify:CR=1 FL=1